VTPRFKIKLAAIAKDEGFYLPLWVYHHLHFGFDVIDIRINDTTDNSLKILEKLKAIYGARLRFSVADKELQACKEKDANFQAYIYTQIHEETLKEDFTHLIFLDIDEYWCAANFNETIKDFLTKNSDFDVCMFQWLIELPNSQRALDDFAFSSTIAGQKSDHVKSLMNTKAAIVAVRIHNCVVKQGRYILPDHTQIDFPEDDRSRGILPTALFEAGRLKLENYFVYHQVFRSQTEYVAGLLRGNKQNGDDSLLKTNRFGFLPTNPVDYNLTWTIDPAVLSIYQQNYFELIKKFPVEFAEARQFVLTRKEAVIAYLQSNSFLQQIYASKMRGIGEDIYQRTELSYPFKASVSKLVFDEESRVCSFNCEISSPAAHYELLITQSFLPTPVPATLKLLSEQLQNKTTVKKFQVAIAMQDLAYVIYSRQPPFCLVAKLGDQLIVLERMKFRSVAPAIATHAQQLRKLELQQPKVVAPKLSGFWNKLLGRA